MEFHPSLLNLCLWVLFVILQRHRCLGCAADERTALLEIKASASDPDDYPFYTWVADKTSDYCSWNRIKCSNTTVCVSQLDLSSALLDDDYILLNVSLFLPFKDLQHLDISSNDINGTRGHQGFEKLAKLRKLRVLNLAQNHFNISVLEPLSELTSLRTLNLNDNYLGDSSSSAEISQGVEKLAKLRKLQVLNLGGNRFNISVLEPLSELTSLRALYLDGNLLGGSSSLEISQGFEKLLKLKRLKFLDLEDNNLNHPSILVLLSKLASLQNLNLHQNQLGMGSSIEISQDSVTATDASSLRYVFGVDPISFLASCAGAYVVSLLALVIVLYINPYWRRLWFDTIDACLSFMFPFWSEAFYRVSNPFT